MDQVLAFAQAVSEGEITAGPSVRLAAQRHIGDLADAESGKSIYVFDMEKSERVIGLFPKLFMLTKIKRQPFVLLPWQAFIVGSLFGWFINDGCGTRRFKRAYVETGKGSGKSPLGAALMLLNCMVENRAEVYSVAKTKEQAAVAFEEAVSMIRANKALASSFRIIGGYNPRQILFNKDKSKIEKLSSDNKQSGKSGPMASFLLIDEYHEHDSSEMMDFYVASFKSRQNPLCFIITNSGQGVESPCFHEHISAMSAVEPDSTGDKYFDRYFSYVCDLDTGDDIRDKSVWQKTNPSYPYAPTEDYIDTQLDEAKANPPKKGLVERLAFCRWQDAESPWITREILNAMLIDELPSDIAEYPCYISLDLSKREDPTALAYVWDLGDRLIGAVDIFVPEERLKDMQDRYKAPFAHWKDEGFLTAIPGAAIQYEDVADCVVTARKRYNVAGLTYDAHKMSDLMEWLEKRIRTSNKRSDSCLWMVRHAQGFSAGSMGIGKKIKSLYMPASIENMQAEMFSGKFKLLRNPFVRFSLLGSVVIADGKGNQAYSKKKAQAPDDAAVALTMASGFAIDNRKPHYEADFIALGDGY